MSDELVKRLRADYCPAGCSPTACVCGTMLDAADRIEALEAQIAAIRGELDAPENWPLHKAVRALKLAAKEAKTAHAEGYAQGVRDALRRVQLSLWKHGGDDAYSQGMDAGAVHQNKADCAAILALLDATPAPEKRQAAPRYSPGLYRVFWKSGGQSEAAIGCSANGDNWIAPTNWISTAMLRDLEKGEWGGIDTFEVITPAPVQPSLDAVVKAALEWAAENSDCGCGPNDCLAEQGVVSICYRDGAFDLRAAADDPATLAQIIAQAGKDRTHG